MPAPTITPTGELGKSLYGLAYLLASTAQFQSITGAANAAAALAFVHVDADDTPDSPDDRPRAIVEFERQYSREDAAIKTFDSVGALLLSLEFAPSAADSPWDELLEFCERVDTIKSQMQTLAGTGTGPFAGETHFNARRISLVAGPTAFTEVRGAAGGESRAYLYGCVLRVDWEG